MVAFASSLDQAGPISKSVDDAALMLEVMCSHDEKDSTSLNVPTPHWRENVREGVKGLKIGIPKEYRVDGMSDEIEALWQQGIDWLKAAGAEIVDVSLGGVSFNTSLVFRPGTRLELVLVGALEARVEVVAWRVAAKRGYARGSFPGWPVFARALVFAIPGLMTAIIIMGGILSGIFTATESSAVAVIYTVAVGALVYRTLGWKRFSQAAMQSVKITAMVLLIIGAATAFGYALAILEAPAQLASLITAATDNPILVLLIINLILLVLGTFMDMSPLIVITTPILLPVVMQVGVDPVHFGIIMMLNLGIGLVTPPVGSVLFVGAAVGKVPVEHAVKTIWPFYGALIVALLFVTFVPALSLTLPNLF
jgi:TRAP-type mannitol/chloroaromatic compound transport system permease large subunit